MTVNAPSPSAEPRLSICVPAWRGQTLGRFLDSVRAQTHPLNYELRVRDDCSPHGVGEAFQKHHQGEPHWHYQRNSTNLGGYDNIRACGQGARGRYVLLISDDDCLVPDAFAILDKLLALADQCNAPACFVCDRLNRKYGEASILSNPFAWLRDVSINVPAFISRVIWRRPFWEAYAYEAYPPEMSLPQLDCFLDACLKGPIVAGCRDLVQIGTADNTDRPSYWFYTRHAPVDCFEYPNLYRKVLGQGRPDLRSRFWIYARRIALLRESWKKVLFMRYNEQFYHPTIEQFCRYNGFTLHGVALLPALWMFLKTPIGSYLARNRYGDREKLPARPADARGW